MYSFDVSQTAIGIFVSLLIFGFTSVHAQEESGEVFKDVLLDDLVGEWTMEGHVRGDSVTYDATASWVLRHQFLRVNMEDVQEPPEYVAHVYIGFDPETETYVAHWLDDSGGGPSKTLGTGRRDGDTLTFQFEYPQGPFRTVFQRRSSDRWVVRMRAQGEDGDWVRFADFRVHESTTP